MRLLYIVPSFYPALYHGGPVITGFHLCNALAEKGIDLRVLTTDTAGPEKNLDVSDFPTRMPAGYLVYYCRRLFSVSVSPGILWRMCSMIRWADAVHLIAVYSFPTIPALLLCKMLNKPVVWSPKGSFQRWRGSTKVSLKSLWNQVCRLVKPRRLIVHVTSLTEQAETIERFGGVDVVTVQNGVELPEQISRTPRTDTLRLLYLGRLDPIKGVENLLTACSTLNNGARTLWSLAIAGTGDSSYRDKLLRQVDELSLTQQVTMLGEVENAGKEALFGRSDLLVLPSHQESFGMVAAEALAHAVPVLVSSNTPWQRVEDIGCGMWVENDSPTLAASIKKMSQLPLEQMGQRGREWMINEFSWEHRAAEMLQLYQRAMSL